MVSFADSVARFGASAIQGLAHAVDWLPTLVAGALGGSTVRVTGTLVIWYATA
jgi:hypothetical protein